MAIALEYIAINIAKVACNGLLSYPGLLGGLAETPSLPRVDIPSLWGAHSAYCTSLTITFYVFNHSEARLCYLFFVTDIRDYEPIRSLEQDLVIQLDAMNRGACFEVVIRDDNIFEGDDPEMFEVLLVVRATVGGDLDGVSANSSVGVVVIVEDDVIVEVGFEERVVSVNESAGPVEVCVGLLGGLPPEGEEFGAEFRVQVLLDQEDTTAGESGRMCAM